MLIKLNLISHDVHYCVEIILLNGLTKTKSLILIIMTIISLAGNLIRHVESMLKNLYKKIVTNILSCDTTYNKFLLSLSQLLSQLEIRCYRHGLLHSQPRLQQVILHDVRTKFLEDPHVSRMSIDRYTSVNPV